MSRLQKGLFRAGAVFALLTCLAHSAGHLRGPDPPKNPAEAQLVELLATQQFELPGGARRTLGEFVDGFSWTYSILFLLLGALPLCVLRLRPDDGPLLRAVAGVEAGALALVLVVSVRYFFAIPTTFTLLTLAAFAGSLFGRRG